MRAVPCVLELAKSLSFSSPKLIQSRISSTDVGIKDTLGLSEVRFIGCKCSVSGCQRGGRKMTLDREIIVRRSDTIQVQHAAIPTCGQCKSTERNSMC